MVKALIGTCVLWLSMQVPALANWTYYELDAAEGAGVYQSDGTGEYQLDIGCGGFESDGLLYEIKFGLFVPAADVARLAEKAAVPMVVVADGRSFGPFNANLRTTEDGTKVLSALENDDARIVDVVAAVAEASSEIRVDFLGKTVTFEMTGMTAVWEQVQTFCN